MKLLTFVLIIIYNFNLILSQNLSKTCCSQNYNVNLDDHECIDKFGNFTDLNLSCDARWMKSYNLNDTDKIKSDLDNGDLEYCVDLDKVYTCPCEGKDCVNVCCEPGETFNYEEMMKCEISAEEWKNWSFVDNLEDKNSKPPTPFYKIIDCSRHVVMEEEILTVNQSGFLTWDIKEDSIPPEEYCISVVKTKDGTNVAVITCHEELDVHITKEKNDNIIYSTLLLIGALFLLATLLVYAVLPELRRAVQGLSLMAHCACMLVAHLATVVVKLKGNDMKEGPCHIIAYIMQFSFLSGFFWMNVICVDIATKFRSLQSMVPIRTTAREYRKFRLYAIYAMGCPFLMFIITISLNANNENLDDYVKPGIGMEYCWFDARVQRSIAILLYFYLPIGLLILFNCVLFIFTAVRIFIYTRDTQNVTRSGNNDKTSFVLFVKLFMIMGLPWLTEIISWGVGGDSVIWYFTDALNILRSVFIFILFCCKSRIWDLLKARFSSSNYIVQTLSMRTRSDVSNSSHMTTSVTTNSRHDE